MKHHPNFRSGLPLPLPRSAKRKAPLAKKNSAIEPLEARIAPAAVIGATTTKTFFVDADGDGKADPGLDTVQYVVTISNTGDASGTNVSYNDTLDVNTTLFGAVLRSPLAVAQGYLGVGNTQLIVGAGAGLKTNVHDLDGVTLDANLVVTAGTFATSAGGSVTVAADGSFTYTPETGDQNLTDTFTYSVTDGDGLVSTGRASINLGARVWYVDSTYAGANGAETGASHRPYNSLADISGAAGSDTTGDIIFIKNAGAAYDGNLTLLNNEHLYGSGAGLIVNGVTINTAGVNTALTTATAAVNTLTLGSGNDIHGFTLGNSAASATGIALLGSAFGTLSIENITISTTGAGLSLSSGTIQGPTNGSTAAFGNLAASGGTNAILLSAVTGTISDTGGLLTGTASGPTVSIVGGSASLTHIGGITQAFNAAAVSVTGGHTGTLTFNTGTISATAGTGLQFDNADGTYNFSGTTTLNGGDAGIDILNGSSGTFNFGANASITNPTGAVVNISGSTANVNYSGAFTKTNAGTGISVANETGGTINFNGTSVTKALSTTTSTAVNLSSNTGATINFTGGGLVINTTSATAFSATGGGTVTVQGTGNTINATTGPGNTATGVALQVTGTTIGAAGLTFQSIFAGTTTTGPASGIILNATGTSGGLTITGTGTANSGGVIQHTSSHGVSLTSTSNVSFTRVSIHDTGDHGIFGDGVNNFTFSDSTIFNFGNATPSSGASEDGMHFESTNTANTAAGHGLTGTVIIRRSTIGTDGHFTLSPFPSLPENKGIVIRNHNDVNLNMTVTGTTFTQISNDGIDAEFTGGTANLVVDGSTGDGANVFNQINGRAITFSDPVDNTSNQTLELTIKNNTFSNVGIAARWLASARTTLNARFLNNSSGSNVVTNDAIRSEADASVPVAGSPATVNATISGNNMGGGSIFISNHRSAVANISFVNNTNIGGTAAGVGGSGSTGVQTGINVFSDRGSTINIDLFGNTARADGGPTQLQSALSFQTSNNGGGRSTISAFIGGSTVALKNTLSEIPDTGGQQVVSLDTVSGQGDIFIEGWNGTSPTFATFITNNNTLNGTVKVLADNNSFIKAGTGRAVIPALPLAFLATPDEVAVTPTEGDGPGTTSTPENPSITPPTEGGTPTVTPPSVVVDDGVLSQAELDSLVAAAIARWEATGLTPAQDALLHTITFSVDELPGWYLGAATPGHVTLDATAAGNQWFVDTTPNDDSEYSGDGTKLSAPVGVASGRVDALTTVMHELGHQLGLDDTYVVGDASNLMYGYMHLGERRLPGAHQAEGADAHHLAANAGPDFAIGPVTIGTLDAGSSVQVLYRATVNYPFNATSGSNPTITDQGTVTYNGGSTVQPALVTTLVDMPDVNVTLGASTVTESSGTLVYTFSRTDFTGGALTVKFGASGSATFTNDYTAASTGTLDFANGTVIIPAGAASVTVTLTPVDDRLVEGNETVTLTVSSGTGYDIVGGPASGTINDNDTATIGFTTGTSSGLESEGTHNISTTLTINATGTGTIGLASNLTANLTNTGGTATGGGTDYTLPGSPAVTFLAGTYATGTATQLTAVTINDDRQVEGDETAQFGLAIVTNIGTQGSIGGTTSHTETITDNDTATIGFTSGTSTALESAGTQNVGVTLTINAIGTGTIGLASNLTANLTTTGGTATGAGTDYTLPASPAVTFLAGTYATGSGTQNAAITVVDDRQVEGSETAQLGLAIATNIGTQGSIGGTTAHTLTITDNDTATIGFTSGTGTALESVGTQNVGVTLTINAIGTGTIGLASNLTANLTSTGGTATGAGTDYTLPGSPAVTFLAGTYATGTGAQNAAVTVTDDRLVEGDETAQFGLAIATNIGTQVTVAGTTAHTLTLTDNDTATLGYTLGASTAQESAGTQNIGVTLTINAIGTGTIGLASNLTANLTTLAGGTATGGGVDYTLPASPAVTFLAGTYATGTASQNAVVTLVNDGISEGSETANLGLAIVTNIGTQGSISGTTTHVLTIQDTGVSVAIGATPVLESSTTGLVYTFTRTGDTSTALPINFTKGGTATSVTDYTASSTATTFDFAAGTLTIPAGQSSVTVTLVPVDDRLVEGDETATLTVASGAGYGVGGSPATGTVTDNDTVTLGFTVGTSSALESAGTQNISTTLTINAIGTGTIGLASDLTVNLTNTGGTATGGGTDYTLPGSPAITFAAGTYATGTATQNAAVAIVDDRLVEGNETAALGLAILQNIGTQASIGGTTTHTLTLTDNDTATIGFTTGTSTGLESVGTQNISTTLTINAIGSGTIGLASNLTANLTTTGGTATGGGTDYALPGSPAVTFAAGTYATGTATQNAAVAVTDDRLVEGDETAAFGLAIVQNIGTQVSIGGTTAHTLTVTDNDTATIGFTVGTSTGLESVGTQNISTTLTINAIGSGTIGLASNLTANLTTTGGTATGGGTDYTLPGSPAVTFAAGTYATGTATQNAAVAVVDDRLVESTETAAFGLAIVQNIGTQASIGGTTAHTLTITDNDTATIGFTAGTSTGLESVGTQNVGVTLTINAIGSGTIGLASNLTANLTSTGGTATGSGTDYTLPGSPAVTFAAGTYATGTATQNAAIAVTDDRQVEGDETAAFGLAIVTNIGTQASLGGTTAHTLTITDNDTATLSFTVGSSSVAEAAGTQNISTTLTINAIGSGTIGLTSNITANLTTTGGTATGGGTDYTLPGSPAVTFAAGTYATGTATQNAAVAIVNDTLGEANETAILGLGIVQNIGTQASVGGTTAHTLTILDDDTAVSVAVAPASATEAGGTLVYTFTRTGDTSTALTVNFNVGGAATFTNDYTQTGAATFLAGSGTVSIPIGQASTTITLQAVDDRLVEGSEDATLTVTAGVGYGIGGTPATGTITDNDTATIGFTAGTSTALESAGTQNISTTLTINAIGTGPIGLASNLTANLTGTGGTATGGGTDYALPASPAVTFAAGTYATATATQNAVLNIVDDRLVEGTESAALGLSIAQNIGTQVSTGGTTAHTLTITDNDTATIGFVAATSTKSEGAESDLLSAVLTINATGTGPLALARDVSVNLSGSGTATSGADYTLPGTLTFLAGDATGAQHSANLAIVDDFRVEGSETVQAALAMGTDGTGGAVTIATAAASHTTTITDNDTAKVQFFNTTSTSAEGSGPVTLTAVLSLQVTGTGGPIGLDRDIIVGFTSTGGTATNVSDYTLPGSVTFAAGSQAGDTKSANLAIIDDTLVEGTETAVLGLSILNDGTGGQASILAGTSHTATINDNDVDLSITKTDGVTSKVPGTVNTYTITVTNSGLTPVTGASVTDLFPNTLTGVTWTSVSPNGGTGTAVGSGNITDTVNLPAGSSLTYTVTGTVLSSATGTLVNTATVGAPAGFTDQNTGNNSATDTDTLTPQGDLSITKTDGLTSVVPGTQVAYTIVVSNAGPSNVIGASVADLFPAGFNAVDYTATGSVGTSFTPAGAGNLNDTVNIPAGGSITYTVHGTLASSLTGSFSNTATVTAPGTFTDANQGNNSATDTDTLTPRADVSVLKTGPASAVAGTDITYHITVNNSGPSDAQTVNLSDLLPAGTSLISFDQISGPANGGVLPTGGTQTYDLVVHVNSNVADGTILKNTANVTTSTTDLNSENNSSFANSTVVAQADLSLTKTDSPDPLFIGGNLTYTITLHNNGSSDAQNVSLTDVIPAGFTFVSLSTPGGWSATTPAVGANGTVTLTKTSVTNGEDDVFTLVVAPSTSVAGTDVTNTATVTSATTDVNAANNSASATTTVAGVDLTLVKTDSLTATTPGSTLTYVLNYGNAGSAPATGVVITETLPAGTNFVAADNPGWTQVGATNQYTYAVPGSLAANATGTVNFVVHVNASAPSGLEQIANTATIGDDASHGIDITPADNTANDSDTLNAAPDLSVSITDSPSTVVRGGFVIYTVHYSNVGNQDATNVVISQTLPANTTFDFLHSSGGWNLVGSHYEFNVASLAGAGGSGDVDFAVKVNTVIPGGYNALSTTSTITDNLANGTDPVSANNTDTELTPIYQGIYVVAPGVALPRRAAPPVIRVFDIATGVETDISAYESTYKNSIRVATGDINGDGYDDIITSTITGNGRVRVFDGKTGLRMEGAFSEIAAFTEKGARGAYVASGDVNGDGRDDIIVGSGYAAGGDAKVRVFSGVTGAVISTSVPFGTRFHGGVRVASGDVNGDGVADIIASQGYGGNEVKVTSGISSTVLQDLHIGGTRYRGGTFVSTAADLNNDGKADLVVGRDRGKTIVETFSGATGALLSTITPFSTRYALGARVAAADVNLDGIADIIVAAGGRNGSLVKFFDGVTNAEITGRTFAAFPAFPTGALFVAGTSPVPSIASAPNQD